MSASKHKNTEPSPMEFETFVMPNLANERARLARDAGSITKTELVERAEELSVPTSGSKEEIAARVRNAARND